MIPGLSTNLLSFVKNTFAESAAYNILRPFIAEMMMFCGRWELFSELKRSDDNILTRSTNLFAKEIPAGILKT